MNLDFIGKKKVANPYLFRGAPTVTTFVRQLVVAYVEFKRFEFRVVAVYAPYNIGKRRSFFRRFEPFLDNPKQIILVGDWNAILDPKIDKSGGGAGGSDKCEISLIDLMAQHDLVDRFRPDHPGREIWTWLDSSPSVRIRTYLDIVLVGRADTEFITCPTFHWIELADHKLVRVSLQLVNRPSLANYWRYRTSWSGWKP